MSGYLVNNMDLRDASASKNILRDLKLFQPRPICPPLPRPGAHRSHQNRLCIVITCWALWNEKYVSNSEVHPVSPPPKHSIDSLVTPRDNDISLQWRKIKNTLLSQYQLCITSEVNGEEKSYNGFQFSCVYQNTNHITTTFPCNGER